MKDIKQRKSKISVDLKTKFSNNRRFLGSLRNRKGFQREDTNFALIVVGIVAVVAIIGMLNFGGITAKTTGQSKSVVKTETGQIFYCAPDCNNECTGTCIGIKTRTGTKAASTAHCPSNLNYDAEGTYYMHYFCG